MKKLSQLTLLDSFVHEVLRTRGDTWGPIRQTTKRIRIGPYVLPANAMCSVPISRVHQHPDNYVRGKGLRRLPLAEEGPAGRAGQRRFPDVRAGKMGVSGAAAGDSRDQGLALYVFSSGFDIRVKKESFRVTNTINILLCRRRLHCY